MSEQELYEIARQRIDQRNRRWKLWAVNLSVWILSLAALILLGETPYVDAAAAVFMGWGGVLALHTIFNALAESREKNIEKEVERLREAVYEKPKRVELTDDGELNVLTDPDTDTDWHEEDRPLVQRH